MKKNDIELDALMAWRDETEVVYASSTRERKVLTSNLIGTFILTVAGEIVWRGTQPFKAVEMYNEITETYVEVKKNFRL